MPTFRPSLRVSTCCPLHVGHLVWRLRPEPSHAPHGRENTMWPRADFIMPLPWHWPHRVSAVCIRPRPLQVRQCSWRVTVIARCPPRMASSKLRSSVWWRSAPRTGVPSWRRDSRWPITSAKRSPKVGADAPLTLTEKSKPSNPNVVSSTAA